jgi:hypothetical protein
MAKSYRYADTVLGQAAKVACRGASAEVFAASVAAGDGVGVASPKKDHPHPGPMGSVEGSSAVTEVVYVGRLGSAGGDVTEPGAYGATVGSGADSKDSSGSVQEFGIGMVVECNGGWYPVCVGFFSAEFNGADMSTQYFCIVGWAAVIAFCTNVTRVVLSDGVAAVWLRSRDEAIMSMSPCRTTIS